MNTNGIHNGVKIIRHKKWNTKKVHTISGHLANTYLRCPQNINFKNEMVNDENQHLCGGWTYYENSTETAINRVLLGLKPMCCVAFYKEKSDLVYEIANNLKHSSSFYVVLEERECRKDLIYLSIAKKGKWDDLGWITGLILGYPIENTISLYLED